MSKTTLVVWVKGDFMVNMIEHLGVSGTSTNIPAVDERVKLGIDTAQWVAAKPALVKHVICIVAGRTTNIQGMKALILERGPIMSQIWGTFSPW